MAAISTAGEKTGLRSIHWFRKGLRLHDNPALLDAIRGCDQVFPVFVIDPKYANPEKVGVLRYQFLLECLTDLDESLKKRGSKLIVVRGDPTEVLPRLLTSWSIDRLTFEADTEPYAKLRDRAVGVAARDAGVHVASHHSHTLRDLDAYLSKSPGGKAPGTYQAFLKVLASLPAPPAALQGPDALPPLSQASEALLVATLPDGGLHAVPTLTDMGYPAAPAGPKPSAASAASSASSASASPSSRAEAFFAPRPKSSGGAGASGGSSQPLALPEPTRFPGGESAALLRLEAHMARHAWVHAFEKPKTLPNSLDASTTVLSPYLKFGCLSPRTFYHALEHSCALAQAAPLSLKPSDRTQAPVSLTGQLLWREFFYLSAHATPNFGRMDGNPVCRQIDWDDNPAFLLAWEEGRTGYPFIDAIMTQLRVEGWIHHLARHSVACFLTRGDLYQSWEAGAAVFDRLLLDADWSLNSANWMWLSCSAFFHQYFRCYSPVAFGKKTDPNGDYIRKWLPQLRKYPAKFIYEPWKAPLSVQKECGCVVGAADGYPTRIVDHDVVSKANMARLKVVYDKSKAAATATASQPEPKKQKK